MDRQTTSSDFSRMSHISGPKSILRRFNSSEMNSLKRVPSVIRNNISQRFSTAAAAAPPKRFYDEEPLLKRTNSKDDVDDYFERTARSLAELDAEPTQARERAMATNNPYESAPTPIIVVPHSIKDVEEKLRDPKIQRIALEATKKSHSDETLKCLLAIFRWEDCEVTTIKRQIAFRIFKDYLRAESPHEVCLPDSIRHRFSQVKGDQDMLDDLVLEAKRLCLNELRFNQALLISIS